MRINKLPHSTDQFILEPAAPLAQDVRKFWFIEEAQDIYNWTDIIPDSYCEVIINLGAPLRFEKPGSAPVEMPSVYLGPLQSSPQKFRAMGSCQILAVSLYPWAVPTLLPDAMFGGKNGHVTLDGPWMDLARLLGKLVETRGYEEAIALLEQFVIDHQRPLPPELAPLRAVGQGIYAGNGQASILKLAERHAVSASQLERRFKHIASVTPKTYARLVRFEAIRDALFIDPWRSLADLAYEFGYTDQAHLTRDFKTFAAMPPGEFASGARTDRQPAEFLQYA